MACDFDEIKRVTQGRFEIEYGVIHGNETLAFIKVGMKGSIYGYQNKYLTMADNLHKRHGCSVIVSSNPNGYDDDFEAEMHFLKDYAQGNNWSEYQIYYFGHSNGACLGLINGYKYPEIKRIVAVNGPLMIDQHKLFAGIEKFKGEKLVLYYGSKDPTLFWVECIDDYVSERVKYKVIAGADHNFTGFLDLFLSLPEEGFFGE